MENAINANDNEDSKGAALLGQPMKGGFLQQLPAGASKEEQTAVLNDIISRLNDMLKSQVFSDGDNKRMIIGYQKDGWGEGKHFGIKVSIEGVDVTKATDEQLLFKMDLETWFYYDPKTHKDIIQVGILPDGTGGIATAKPGFGVKEAYNS